MKNDVEILEKDSLGNAPKGLLMKFRTSENSSQVIEITEEMAKSLLFLLLKRTHIPLDRGVIDREWKGS